MKTAILGGGLSGLTLARLLHEKGDEVIVLEAEREYGGLCRSKKERGFTFDTGGSHIIFSRDAEVLTFMRRMIADNEQRNNRTTKIFYKRSVRQISVRERAFRFTAWRTGLPALMNLLKRS